MRINKHYDPDGKTPKKLKSDFPARAMNGKRSEFDQEMDDMNKIMWAGITMSVLYLLGMLAFLGVVIWGIIKAVSYFF